ncbi:ester cyclase [Saccharothrix luteola]|uniref:ester cyclase n=1 Tax=Saccharothrix luteola TaxID=2893018 RepID=UPI001E512278|nr:ester cyclase [Saccharothrix luteola]MCC8244865.1 ester cyclase [Saccharothrix luteola]
MSRDDLARLEEACVKAWDQHDADGFASLLTEDCVVIDDMEPKPLRSRDAARRYAESWFTAFPDMRVQEKNRVIGDDGMAVELELKGTNTGPLEMGGTRLAPTGRRITAGVNVFMKARGGRIREIHSHSDSLSMMSQLGLAGSSAPA